MALDIWRKEGAELVDLEAMLKTHAERGLTIVVGRSGEPATLNGAARPAQDLAGEVLRLACIGADAVAVLRHRTRALSHFSSVMQEVRRWDARRLKLFLSGPPGATRRPWLSLAHRQALALSAAFAAGLAAGIGAVALLLVCGGC